MNVLVLKLITGEEIVAEVLNDGAEETVVQNGLQLVPQQGPDGKLGVGVFPWGNHVDGPVTLEDKHIIYVGVPKAELLDLYNKAFGSIVVPPSAIALA